MNPRSRIVPVAVFGVLALSLAVPFARAQQTAPAAQPDEQQPAVSQKVQGSQVENMPGYNQGQPTQAQPANEPRPNETIVNGPPATAPLQAPPPLPVRPLPAYRQDARDLAQPAYRPGAATDFIASAAGSTYIPLDSWINDAVLRLYSLGYVDTVYLGIRPWTRLSILHMLSRCSEKLGAEEQPDSEASQIYETLRVALSVQDGNLPGKYPGHVQVETVYTRLMGITGSPLDSLDSYSVGQTIVNDYGRPYAGGFNNVTGYSAKAEQGRFSFYIRGEYQHAPAWTGYNATQALFLQNSEENYVAEFPAGIPTLTIPTGQIAGQDNFSILEADIAVHLLGHEISVGKHDEWLGPNQGGAFAFSNNAQPIYALKINRVEPLYIPLMSRVLGPVRYQFFVGSLKGHAIPSDPWVHSEKFEFKPTANFEFGFTRNVIWGGRNHEGISFGTFWKTFYSISDTNPVEKCLAYSNGTFPPNGYAPPHVPNCKDPGARFSQFDYSYRLPWVRKYLTWTVDSFVHDDVTPISAPRRSAIRTGLYLSQFPGLRKLDLRAEGGLTDPDTGASQAGRFVYWETIEHEGMTNKGMLFSDVLGREGKGGNAWLTYHLSPSEFVQASYRNNKQAKDYIPGGTTQNDYTLTVVKRLVPEFEVKAWAQYERYNIPFLVAGPQHDVTITGQFTWYPKLNKQF